MKTTNKLLLVFVCLALLAFSGCTDKKEAVQPEPGWQVIDFVWSKENGDKLTLSVTVPEEWDKDSVRKEGCDYRNGAFTASILCRGGTNSAYYKKRR